MDVRLINGRIHSHAAPFDHLFGLSNLNNSLVHLLDRLWPERPTPTAHGLGIGHLCGADVGEFAIHQIGAHFTLQNIVAPIANAPENQ